MLKVKALKFAVLDGETVFSFKASIEAGITTPELLVTLDTLAYTLKLAELFIEKEKAFTEVWAFSRVLVEFKVKLV